jgi:hypothetical protein
MIVARQLIAWIAYEERPRPGGTPDSGQAGKIGAHNLPRISAVPSGRSPIFCRFQALRTWLLSFSPSGTKNLASYCSRR